MIPCRVTYALMQFNGLYRYTNRMNGLTLKEYLLIPALENIPPPLKHVCGYLTLLHKRNRMNEKQSSQTYQTLEQNTILDGNARLNKVNAVKMNAIASNQT